jgi:hypothetical protein
VIGAEKLLDFNDQIKSSSVKINEQLKLENKNQS